MDVQDSRRVPAWSAPWRFSLRFQDDVQASLAAVFPDAVLKDDGVTVEVPARDFEDGYFRLRRMLKAASVASFMVLRGQILEAQPNAEALQNDLFDRMMNRWLNPQPPPVKDATSAPAKPRYWGAR